MDLSFLSWWWLAFAVVMFAAFLEIKDAVQEREHHVAGDLIMGVIFGSIAIYRTENCIFCLSQNLLDGSIYGAVALTLGLSLLFLIYCRIRY